MIFFLDKNFYVTFSNSRVLETNSVVLNLIGAIINFLSLETSKGKPRKQVIKTVCSFFLNSGEHCTDHIERNRNAFCSLVYVVIKG